MIQATLINLNRSEYSKGLRSYPFAVNLDTCVGSCIILNDLSKDLNLSVFDIITGINESKTLTKHISCELKCRFGGRKCKSNQIFDNDKSLCECKNPEEYLVCKKDYFWNPATCTCENGKYLGKCH